MPPASRRFPLRPAALALVPALALILPVPAASSGREVRRERAATPAAKPAPSVPVAHGRLFAVVLGPGPAWKRGQPFKGPGLEAHRRYWARLHAEGRVASAGPLGADTGLAVIRAGNQREADALIAADPAVQARILRGVARPYVAALVSPPVLVGR